MHQSARKLKLQAVVHSLYSVPNRYLRKYVRVRADKTQVKIYFGTELIKVHPRKAPGISPRKAIRPPETFSARGSHSTFIRRGGCTPRAAP
jgi:hypothetical protein